MTARVLARTAVAWTCAAVLMAATAQAQAPAASVAGDGTPVPRTADGRPDLQGVWANNNMTPLERPKQWAGRATITDAERVCGPV